MKTLAEFINESSQINEAKTITTTIGALYAWYCENLEPKNSKLTEKDVDVDACSAFLDNGWFEHFDDNDPHKGCEQIAEFIRTNFNQKIVISCKEERLEDWIISFKFEGKTYTVQSLEPFGVTY